MRQNLVMRWSLKSTFLVVILISGVICQESSNSNAEFPQITGDQPEEILKEDPKPHIQPGAPEVVVEAGPDESLVAQPSEHPQESQGDEVSIAPGPTEETFPPEVTEQDPFATTAAPGLTTKVAVVADVGLVEPLITTQAPESVVSESGSETGPQENQHLEENASQPEASEPSPESPPVSPVVIEEASPAPEAAAPVTEAPLQETSAPETEAPQVTEAAVVVPQAAVTEDPMAAAQNDDDVFAGDKSLFQQEGTMKVLTEEFATSPVEVVTEAAVTIEPVFPRIELPAETGEEEEKKEPEAVVVTQPPTESESMPPLTEEKAGDENLPFAPAASFMPDSETTTAAMTDNSPAENVPVVPVVVETEMPASTPEPSPEPSPEPTAEPAPVEVMATKEPKPEIQPTATAEPSVAVVTVNAPTAEPAAVPEPAADPSPEPEPEPKAETTLIPVVVAEPEPEPKAEPGPEPTAEPKPEPSAEPEPAAEPTAEPEPSAEPKPSAEPEPAAEPEPSAEPVVEMSTTPFVAIDEHHHHHQHAIVAAAPNANAHRMPFSLRFPNIEFNDEFLNTQSGSFKKLNDQIGHDFRKVLTKVLGDNFVDYEIVEMRPGSVIVEGRIVTKQEIMDPEGVVEQVEQVIDANGNTLGGNQVDTKSITVNGFVSKGNLEPVTDPAATKTGLVIFAAIGIGFLIIAAVIVAIIVFGIRKRNARRDSHVMKRRSNGSLKLKENIDLAENGRSSYQPQGNVNLMGYGKNGSTTTGDVNKPGMVMTSSQFSSPTALQTTST